MTKPHAGTLDAQQRRVYYKILDDCRSEEPQRYHYITGLPGCGKTFLTKALIAALIADYSVVPLAWSGIVADQLNGSTIMGYFGLGFTNSGRPGDNAYLRSASAVSARICKYYKNHGHAEIRSSKVVVIIDEIEALHASVLDGLAIAVRNIRSSTAVSNAGSPFADAVVIFVGDPCQSGRVEPMTDEANFPVEQYPLKPFWEAESWDTMKPSVAYLTSFHRCQDVRYLQLLREIRSSQRIEPGLPIFSSQSLQLLQNIRDRDGGEVQPRFPHTTICLTNSEVDRRNDDYLSSLPGEKYEFQCLDSVEPTASNFDFDAVARLGYKPRVVLKPGCRVMATANSHHRNPAVSFSNGAMGTVLRIYNDELGERTVVVDFDHYEKPIHVKRQAMIVRGFSNEIVFERRQIPLAPCYAITAHKVLGSTLLGVWAHFSPRSSRLEDMARFWQAPWLQGIAYTVLSRVSGADYIRVFPLKNTLSNSSVFPIFTIDPAALQYDGECAQRSWLASEPLIMSPRLSEQHSTAPPGDTSTPTDAITSLKESISKFSDELRKFKLLSLISQHYATRNHSLSGDPINPVFYCATRATLSAKVDNMSADAQVRFYDLLNQTLNLTFPKPSQDILDRILGDLAEQGANGGGASDNSSQRRISDPSPQSAEEHNQPRDHGFDRSQKPATPDQEGDEDIHSTHSINNQDDVEESAGVPIPPEMSDEMSDSTEDGLFEVPVRPEDPPARESRFIDEPYTAFEGSLHDVVAQYLVEHEHFELMKVSIEALKSRKTCYLECKRTVGSRFAGKPPCENGRPDWRCWESFTCPMKEVKVHEDDGYTFFYPLNGVQATTAEWREHAHYPGTTTCRSKTIPPDLVDDWVIWHASDPGQTKQDLQRRSHRKHLEGGYSIITMEFITNKGLKNYTAFKQLMVSITKSKSSGLSVLDFCRRLETMSISEDRLRSEVNETIRSLRAVAHGTHNEADLSRACRGDACMVLGDVLFEPGLARGSRRGVKKFSAVVTSARMLQNLANCHTIGVDATFNITYADLSIGLVCSLPKTSTAQPVALIIMHRESTDCFEHGLKEITRAALAVGLNECTPVEAVLDGSDAIHTALVRQYGSSALKCSSCYFHVLKRAKEAKGKARLSGALWREIKRDLHLLGDSTSRGEWLNLRNLFVRKWSQGKWAMIHRPSMIDVRSP